MWLRGSCLAYLLLSATADAAERLQRALDQDSDCDGAAHCALSAVQRRATPSSSCGVSLADCLSGQPPLSGFFKLMPGDYESLLMPPPQLNGTAEDMAALQYNLLANSASTVLSQWAYLSDENIYAYSPAVGANLEKVAPTFSACIMAFYKPIGDVKEYFKEKVQRLRPFQVHPSVRPCLPEEFSFSYPSGHATFYAATEELLGAFFPQQRDRLEFVSNNGVQARAKCGVHYPSDEHAGRKLAKMAAMEIMQKPEWQQFVQNPSQKILEELAAINKTRPLAGLPIFPSMSNVNSVPLLR